MDRFEKKIIANIQQWAQGKKVPPYLVTFRVTDACDLKCLFCESWKNNTGIKELQITDYQNMFKELNKMGVKLCAILGGGEALCRKKITLEIIRLANKYKMKCWMVTNGMNLQESDIKQMIKLNLDSILISIDSHIPETHDFLRAKKGSFDRVIRNIKLFNYWKKKLNKRYPLIKIQMLITNKNYKDIKGMLGLSKHLSINKLMLNYLVIYKRGAQLKLNAKQTKELKKNLTQILNKCPNNKDYTNFKDYLKITCLLEKYKKTNKLNYKSKRDTLIDSYCFQPWLHLNISQRGFINYCPEFNNLDKRENIKNKSLEKIWHGEEFTKIRKNILIGKIVKKCMRYCNLPIFIENLKIKQYLQNDKYTGP